MKRKVITIIISVSVCAILSILIEILGFNFKVLTMSDVDKNPITPSYAISQTKDKDCYVINIDAHNQYINKLIINYDSPDRIYFTMNYTHPGAYDIETETTIEDYFDQNLTTSVTNLASHISTITIAYQCSEDYPGTPVAINSIAIDNSFHFNFTRTISVFLTLVIIASLIFFYKNGFKSEKLHIYFATLCILLGTIIIIVQPAASFYSYDDQIHFQKVLEIFYNGQEYSLGEYYASGADITHSAGRGSINSNEEKLAQAAFFNTNSSTSHYAATNRFIHYNKIAYLPMAIGYYGAKLIGLPFTVCFRIGKFFNLLAYSILVAYAIKKIKIGKRLLTVIAILPSNIFLASSYSYDPAVFAGLTVFIAELTNLYIDKTTKFNFKTALIMITSMSYACFTKTVYAPFLLLILFIPRDRFSNAKQSHLVKAGFVAITMTLASTFILPALSGTLEGDIRGGETSVNDQLALIFSHPLEYVKILGNTAIAQFSNKFIGAGALNSFAYINSSSIGANSNFYYILLALIFLLFFTDNAKNKLTKFQRWALLSANLLTALFIWTALYLSYTPVGLATINGVQDRYFLPLLFPLLICIQPKNIQNKITTRTYNLITLTIPTVIMIFAIFTCFLIPYAS